MSYHEATLHRVLWRLPEKQLLFHQKDRLISWKDKKYVTALRVHLHWASASKQSQRFDDPSNTYLIENTGNKWSLSRMGLQPILM